MTTRAHRTTYSNIVLIWIWYIKLEIEEKQNEIHFVSWQFAALGCLMLCYSYSSFYIKYSCQTHDIPTWIWHSTLHFVDQNFRKRTSLWRLTFRLLDTSSQVWVKYVHRSGVEWIVCFKFVVDQLESKICTFLRDEYRVCFRFFLHH